MPGPYCGANVCDDCEYHDGLARCYCGWSESGGDGRQELRAELNVARERILDLETEREIAEMGGL